MGEPRRRILQTPSQNIQKKSKSKSDVSQKIFSWLPITYEQENMFIRLSIRGAWIGIGGLVLLWIVVRVVGPLAGWWVPHR